MLTFLLFHINTYVYVPCRTYMHLFKLSLFPFCASFSQLCFSHLLSRCHTASLLRTYFHCLTPFVLSLTYSLTVSLSLRCCVPLLLISTGSTTSHSPLPRTQLFRREHEKKNNATRRSKENKDAEKLALSGNEMLVFEFWLEIFQMCCGDSDGEVSVWIAYRTGDCRTCWLWWLSLALSFSPSPSLSFYLSVFVSFCLSLFILSHSLSLSVFSHSHIHTQSLSRAHTHPPPQQPLSNNSPPSLPLLRLHFSFPRPAPDFVACAAGRAGELRARPRPEATRPPAILPALQDYCQRRGPQHRPAQHLRRAFGGGETTPPGVQKEKPRPVPQRAFLRAALTYIRILSQSLMISVPTTERTVYLQPTVYKKEAPFRREAAKRGSDEAAIVRDTCVYKPNVYKKRLHFAERSQKGSDEAAIVRDTSRKEA